MSEQHTRRGFVKGAAIVAGSLLSGGAVSESAEAQVDPPVPSSTKTARFRALIGQPEPLLLPVIPDSDMGRLCELMGFQAIFIGGNTASTTLHGIPDIGLISVTELIEWTATVAGHTNLPLLTGGVHGGGSPLHVFRATRGFEKAGAAGVKYEDGSTPTNTGEKILPMAYMVDKIKAAVDARTDPNFVLVIQTVALSAGRSMNEALDRGAAYAAAGADVLFFGGMRFEDHARAFDVVKKPLISSIRAPLTPADAQRAKINLLYYHVERIGWGAIYKALMELKTTGKIEKVQDLELPVKIRQQLVNWDGYIALEKKYNLR